MKKWSKAIAIGLCVCLIGTAAIAETAGVDAVSSSTRTTQSQQMQGSQNQQTPPAMPGQQSQGDQNQLTPPAMPGQQEQGNKPILPYFRKSLSSILQSCSDFAIVFNFVPGPCVRSSIDKTRRVKSITRRAFKIPDKTVIRPSPLPKSKPVRLSPTVSMLSVTGHPRGSAGFF